MKFYLWFLIGCACVGIPYFALYQSYDLWPSVIGGIAGGVLFFILLFVLVIKKYFSMKEQIFIGSVHSILVVAFLWFSMIMYQTTSFQRTNLNQIRSKIGVNIIIDDEIYRRATPLLRVYYDQFVQQNRKSLVEVFKLLYGHKIQNGVFYPNTDIPNFHSPTWTFVQYSGDSLIKLISIDSIGKGRVSDFVGYTGQQGKIQITAEITKEGVRYEQNN